MSDFDLILICQSNVVDYDAFSALPLDRLDLYETQVYPRMVRHQDRFVGHLDLINQVDQGQDYFDAGYAERRGLLNIWNFPSAAGLHIANYLSALGFRTKVINNIDSEWDWFEAAYGSCRRPPLVGISSTFYLSIKEVARVAKRLRALDPDMDIVLGGPFANTRTITGKIADFETTMRKYGIRYVLHAFNSEYDLRDLLRARRDETSVGDIKNLCYFEGNGSKEGRFVATATQWHSPLLGDTPANWHTIEAPFLNRTIQIRTAASCPFDCAFCSYPTTAGDWKTMSIDHVRRHLESIKRIPNIDRIVFIDDTFNVPPHRFRELIALFTEYDFEWFSFLRVQYVNDEIVRMMRDSGCKGVYLGVESADDRVLANMNKRVKRKDFEKGVALLNKHGIHSLSAIVLGFPGEDDASIRANIDFIENCGVEFYSLKEFFYMEHTSVHDKREQYGLTGMGAAWSHKTMNYEQAARIKLDMFREIKNATHLDPDTSLWLMAYLYDQGHDFAAIRGMQKRINDIVLAQMNGDFAHAKELQAVRDFLPAWRGPAPARQHSPASMAIRAAE